MIRPRSLSGTNDIEPRYIAVEGIQCCATTKSDVYLSTLRFEERIACRPAAAHQGHPWVCRTGEHGCISHADRGELFRCPCLHPEFNEHTFVKVRRRPGWAR